jgi:glycosyltransferase involved in cell wall biosynthesis
MAQERAEPSAWSVEPDEVIVYHDEQATIAQARNIAARHATSEWLCFLDADDEFAPGYMGAMRRAAEQTDGDFLLTPAVQQIRKGRPGAPSFFDRGISLEHDNWLVVGTLVRRATFERVGGFGEYPHGFEDWSLWHKCWRTGSEIVKVPDAVYRYYINPQSKHKRGWRDRKWQVATHQRVAAELAAWEPS